jgi:hypothetical protein
MNCTFQDCGIGDDMIPSLNPYGGGALAIIEGRNCESESCDFGFNVDGSVLINSRGIFRNCSFICNEGYCGGFYITSYSNSNFNCNFNSTLSLMGCDFAENYGSSGASHIYFETWCIFSASDCLYVWSMNPSIFFPDDCEFIVNLSSICFTGFGLHLSLPQKEGYIVFNLNDLYFDNSKSDAISGFFPNATDKVNISYNCRDCGTLNSNWRSGMTSAFVSFDSFSLSRYHSTASLTFTRTLSASVSPNSSTSNQFDDTLETVLMIALPVVGGLILIVLVVVCLWKFFRRKSQDEVLPSQWLNQDIEMVSINRSNNTELFPSGDSINNDRNSSDRNSSSDFEFEPDLEEIQL